MGTHAELLRMKGQYYRLYTKQFRQRLEQEYDLNQLTGMAPASFIDSGVRHRFRQHVELAEVFIIGQALAVHRRQHLGLQVGDHPASVLHRLAAPAVRTDHRQYLMRGLSMLIRKVAWVTPDAARPGPWARRPPPWSVHQRHGELAEIRRGQVGLLHRDAPSPGPRRSEPPFSCAAVHRDVGQDDLVRYAVRHHPR